MLARSGRDARLTRDFPIDLHVDKPRLSGGLVRTFDATEFVRIGAPVLKTGNSALEGNGIRPTARQVDDTIAQVEIVAEFLDRYAPDARQSPSRRDARPPVTPV